MKATIIQIVLIALVLLFVGITFKQCSDKKQQAKQIAKISIEKHDAISDYIKLVKAKTMLDTVEIPGPERVVNHPVLKPVVDTLFVDKGKVYGLFRDSIVGPDLTLWADITASDLRAINYRYSVKQKTITERSVVYEHDTLVVENKKRHLYFQGDIGIDNQWGVGLHYQGKKRLGAIARYNSWDNKKSLTAGVSVRLF